MTNHPSGASPVVCSQPVASLRKYFTIGQLAREFGLTLRTLRFYEDRGLISPTREGSTRLYSQRDRARLATIVRAKALGVHPLRNQGDPRRRDPSGGAARLGPVFVADCGPDRAS